MSENQETKQCPFCGQEIIAIAKKCRFCGKWLDESNNDITQIGGETITCPACGEQILKTAQKCKHCGEWLNGNNQTISVRNKKELSIEYKKFNWGAFLLSWIWGIGNKTYIALLMLAAGLVSLIPFVGWIAPLVFGIWLGIKGNELAWQNKEWVSLEQFNETQRKWAMWGAIIFGISILLTIIILIVCAVLQNGNYNY